MAKERNKIDDQFAKVETTLSTTAQYVEKNQEKLIKIVVGGIIIVGGLFFANEQWSIFWPNEELEREAQAEMFMAELYFQKDSFNLAVNGNGNYLGFIDISDEYSGTKAATLANYYTGLSYLNTGDFENAIEYLDGFSSDDIILSSLALGCIGDAYMELGDTESALSYYKDAASNSKNEFTTPRFMMKQAIIHEKNDDYTAALTLYKEIKSNYKSSREGSIVQKYIARAENR